MYYCEPTTILCGGNHYPHFTEVELQHQEVILPQIRVTKRKNLSWPISVSTGSGISIFPWVDGHSLLPPWFLTFLHSLPHSKGSPLDRKSDSALPFKATHRLPTVFGTQPELLGQGPSRLTQTPLSDLLCSPLTVFYTSLLAHLLPEHLTPELCCSCLQCPFSHFLPGKLFIL